MSLALLARSLKRLRRPRDRKEQMASCRQRRCVVERLEDRMLLATVTWDGGGDGTSWNNAANWDVAGVNQVPAAGDDVVINLATGNPYTVNLNVSVFTASALGSFTLDSPDATFSATSRTFAVNGASNVVSGNVFWDSSTWTGGASSSLSNSGMTTIRGSSTFSTNSFVQNGSLDIEATASAGGTLTVAAGFTNNGTITLEQIGTPGAADVTLRVSSGTMTNSITGVITVSDDTSDAGTDRFFDTHLTNFGVVNINENAQLSKTNGIVTNHGTFNIAAGRTFSLNGFKVFNQNAGTLAVNGGLTLGFDTFNFNGGSLTGNATVLGGAALNFGAGSTGTAEFRFLGSGILSGNIAAGQTVRIDATTTGSTTVTAASGFTNNGTITLENGTPISGGIATLTVNNGPLLNGPTGVINVIGGISQGQLISSVTNDGIVNFNLKTVLGDNVNTATFINNNTVNIAAGADVDVNTLGIFTQAAGTLNVAGSLTLQRINTFRFNGGSLTGNAPVLRGSALSIGAGSTGAGEFRMQNATTFSGDIAPAQTIRIEALSPFTTNSVLTAATGFTNSGTIILEDTSTPGGSGDVKLVVTSGTLVNSSSGRITVSPDSLSMPDDRQIDAHFTNQGVIEFNEHTQYTKRNGVFANTGDLNIAAGRTVLFDGGNDSQTLHQNAGMANIAGTLTLDLDTFNFAGGSVVGGGTINVNRLSVLNGAGTAAASFNISQSQVNPGTATATGILNVSRDPVAASGGNYTHTSGTLNIQIGGYTPGSGHDQLNIENTANLNGTLNVSFINGFVPNPCDTFDIITYASRTGTKPTVNVTGLPVGLSARVVFGPTTATVVAFNSSSKISIHPTGVNVAEGGTTASYRACLATATAPTGTVTVSRSPDSQLTATPTSLVFNPATDWDLPQQFIVGAVDDSLVEGNHTGTITHSSTSSDASYNNISIASVMATITDNDTATLSFDAATSNSPEATGLHTINVRLTIPGGGTLSRDVSVQVTDVPGGSAGEPADYDFATQTVSFLAGSADGETRQVSMTIADDPNVEGGETVNLDLINLNDGTGGQVTIGALNDHTVTIADNDTATVAFTLAASGVAETAGTHAIYVSLTVPSGGVLEQPIMVDVIDLATGSANSPDDYSFATQTLTFGVGSSSGMQSVSVSVVNDGDPEVDETVDFGLNKLVDGSGGQITIVSPLNHTVTIRDDDQGMLTVDDVQAVEGVGLVFTVTLDKAIAGGFEVNVSLTDVTATGGSVPLVPSSDYDNTGVVLSFSGTTGEQQQFTVSTLDDSSTETGETFIVNLSATSPLVDDSDTATGKIIDNDLPGTLTVTKVIINDNGGTASVGSFTITVTGNNPSPDSFTATVAPGTTVTLNAGAYSVSESGSAGYSTSFSPDCSGTIAMGETKNCIVTNDDIQPKLIVIKQVINNNGGSATPASFTMTVTGNGPSPTSFPGSGTPGTTVMLNAGAYSVGESAVAGYFLASASADCLGTIAPGETKTCTITNDDLPSTGTVTVIADPCDPTKLALLVMGTPGHDRIANDPVPVGLVSKVRVRINKSTFIPDVPISRLGRIIIFGLAGNDHLNVNNSSQLRHVAAVEFGGPGNDYLFGGSSHDILDGGDGNDSIKAEAGRDLLVGGNGRDKLDGGLDDDILIGARLTLTESTINDAALCALMHEWSRTDLAGPLDRVFETRVKHLHNDLPGGLNGGTFLREAIEVIDDAIADELTGGDGRDWYFVRSKVPASFRDDVTDSLSAWEILFRNLL